MECRLKFQKLNKRPWSTYHQLCEGFRHDLYEEQHNLLDYLRFDADP